jgi:aspartate racemase
MLSGIRREKEAPDGLDIEDYSMDLGISDLGREKEAKAAKEESGLANGAGTKPLGKLLRLSRTGGMKTLGIIGGTGPESTIEYYRRTIAAYRARSSEGQAPSIFINSIDNKKLLDLAGANDLAQLADYLASEVERLIQAGADLALFAANTPHLVFDEVQRRSNIPMLSIVEATCDVAVASCRCRLALFGTRFTMQASFYPEIFGPRQIGIVMPNKAEQAYIHQRYMNELLPGIILDETREGLLEIVRAMKQREGVDGLILGGTELSLIFRDPTAASVPVLDTTQIHVEAAVERLLKN